MTLNGICHWIDQTALSQWIQIAGWVVPTVQTIHILAIAVVASSALMLDLRLIGVFWANRPLEAVKARFLPLVWWPLLVLLATGIIMIVAEPARSLKNPAFQLKMGLVDRGPDRDLAVSIASPAQRRVRRRRRPPRGRRDARHRLDPVVVLDHLRRALDRLFRLMLKH